MASNIDTSDLDETKPEEIRAYTADMRANFSNTKDNLNYAKAEIEALQVALAAHLASLSAHAAAAVTVEDTADNFAGTDVEAVLAELYTAILASALNYFAESRSIAAPNATIPVHAFLAIGAETNIDVSFGPKGTGALTTAIADNDIAGGNKRGVYAVDLQLQRTFAEDVASGNRSVVGGGQANRATAEFAAVLSGSANWATALYGVIAGGSDNLASAEGASVVGGSNNTASGLYAACLGGELNQATRPHSLTLGGTYGTTRGLNGSIANASGTFVSAFGEAQTRFGVLFQTTTTATATVLTAGGATLGANTTIVLPSDYTFAVECLITAIDTTTKDSASWKVTVCTNNTAGTLSLIGIPAKETFGKDAGAATWDVTLVTNATLDSVDVQVTGEAAKTIHWVCKYNLVEVG